MLADLGVVDGGAGGRSRGPCGTVDRRTGPVHRQRYLRDILVVFCVSIAGDVAPGDELPIKIVYKDGQSGISDSTGAKDTPMNAWTFTKGITQGGIKLFHDDCGITGSTLGDCNGDKAIDAVDASMVLSLYAKASTTEKAFTDAEFKVCDINGDRLIDSTDASLILSYYSAVSTNKELSIDEFLK